MRNIQATGEGNKWKIFVQSTFCLFTGVYYDYHCYHIHWNWVLLLL